MKKISLLFLSPHWRVSLIKSFQDARPSGNASIRLLGADSDPLAPSLEVVDASFIIPRFDEVSCKSALRKICEREEVDVIFPLTNKAVEFLDRYRKEFHEDLLVYLQNPETIEVCHDKLKLAEFCKREKIPSPLAGDSHVFLERSKFPLIVKPRSGEGSQNCFVVENQNDLEFCSQKYPGHVFQEYVEGREFTIDWFSDHRGTPVLIVPRERLAVRGGEVMVSRICMDPQIIELARKAGTRLQLKGPANLQGIQARNGQFFFTDFNLRFGSGSGHTIAAGGNIPGLIFQDLAGERVGFDMKSIQNGNVMTRYHDAFYFSAEDAETGKEKPFQDSEVC